MIKVNLSEVVSMFERSVAEDENRVIELDMDEDDAPEEVSYRPSRSEKLCCATHYEPLLT